MVQLNQINAKELRDSNEVQTVFPFSHKYLENPEYLQSKYEWYYITDNFFNDPEERKAWLGLICVTEDKYIYGDNLHLSVIEVAEPIRGLSVGTKILDRLIDVARQNEYSTLTLHCKSEDLLGFYERFGFEEVKNDGGMSFHQLKL